MIDDKLNAWLLEVNQNPSLSFDTQLDLTIKGELISDLLNLIGIVSFEHQKQGQHHVDLGDKNTNKPMTGSNLFSDHQAYINTSLQYSTYERPLLLGSQIQSNKNLKAKRKGKSQCKKPNMWSPYGIEDFEFGHLASLEHTNGN